MNLFGVAIVCCALLGWAKFECSATHYESCDSARLMRDCGMYIELAIITLYIHEYIHILYYIYVYTHTFSFVGWRGMTRKQCLDMGCCYKASNVSVSFNPLS